MNLICDIKDRIGRIQINGVHLKWDLESRQKWFTNHWPHHIRGFIYSRDKLN